MAKTTIYQKFKAFERRLNTAKYHRLAENSALKALGNLETDRGKIDASTKRTCDEYAQDILGSKVYAPWLYVYSIVAGEFKEGWIPNNYYGHIVVPAIKGAYGVTSGLKGFTKLLVNSELFPDIIYHVNGYWMTPANRLIGDAQIKEFLFQKHDKIVFKKDNSGQGRGVVIIPKAEFSFDQLNRFGNGVVQGYINQHNFFSEFVTGAVATLRITTVMDKNNTPSVRACYLKLGRKHDVIINVNSQVVIPVDLNSGELYPYGLLQSWHIITEHPDTQVAFTGKRIPQFDRCKEAVLELQKGLPQVRCIGWDVIVDDDDNVKIMEWNGTHNGIANSEATQGPSFADLGWENIWRKH